MFSTAATSVPVARLIPAIFCGLPPQMMSRAEAHRVAGNANEADAESVRRTSSVSGWISVMLGGIFSPPPLDTTIKRSAPIWAKVELTRLSAATPTPAPIHCMKSLRVPLIATSYYRPRCAHHTT